MASTLAEINFNYQKAMQQVTELEAIAGDLKKIGTSDLEGCMNSVKSNWTGDNATAYVGKGNKLKGKITTSAGNVSKAASTLSAIAERIKAAELASLAAIQTRTLK